MGTRFTGNGPVRVASEVQRDVDVFVEKLRRLGAPEEALSEVRVQWAEATPEQRAQVMSMTTAQLREAVRDERARMHESSVPEPDDQSGVAIGLAPIEDGGAAEGAPPSPSSSVESLVGEQGPELLVVPFDVPDGTVPEVLAWVGENVARASAALDVELVRDEPRTTLLDGLRRVLDADT